MNEIVLAAARMAAKQLHEAKSDKGKTSIADIFDAFLEHIDEQAKEIEYWKHGTAQGQDTHEKVAAVLGNTDAPWVLARDMKKENEMLHGQIATLKSICIQERNRYLVDFVHEYDDVMDCKEEAKKQLAREYPEIAWDEKK